MHKRAHARARIRTHSQALARSHAHAHAHAGARARTQASTYAQTMPCIILRVLYSVRHTVRCTFTRRHARSHNRDFSCIISSPYLRCAQTACCVAKKLNLMVRFDLDFGEVFDKAGWADSSGGRMCWILIAHFFHSSNLLLFVFLLSPMKLNT